MKRFFMTLFFLCIVLLTISATAQTGEHWVLKPCPTGHGTCFLPLAYPVYPGFETVYAWGYDPVTWDPAIYDDGDGIPEGVIMFPDIPNDKSWEKINANGIIKSHYSSHQMPFLWCDGSKFSSYQDWASAINTWGYNLKLLDIAGDLTAVWRDPLYKDLNACYVGFGQYIEEYSQFDGNKLFLNDELNGIAVASDGTEYDVRMRLKFQIRGGVMLPEGGQVEAMDFRSAPKKE